MVASSSRRRAHAARTVLFPADSVKETSRRDGIPLVIVDCIVDTIIDDAVPMGIVALEKSWREAHKLCFPELRSMSLVHSTWKRSARRGLRRRIVLSNHCFKYFLCSPLCGPFLTELIIYWNLNPGEQRFRSMHLDLLQEVLSRTPNVRSLAFITVVSSTETYEISSKDIDKCLVMFTKHLLSVECLWVKHVVDGFNDCEPRIRTCPAIRSLCLRLHEFRALRFLSTRSWVANSIAQSAERPSALLKSINIEIPACSLVHAISLHGPLQLECITLSDTEDDTTAYYGWAEYLRGRSSIKKLRLILSTNMNAFSDIVTSCNQLECLDIHALEWTVRKYGRILPASLSVPRSLERAAFHLSLPELQYIFSTKKSKQTGPVKSFIVQFWESVRAFVDNLPLLQLLIIAGTPRNFRIPKVAVPWKRDYLDLGTPVDESKIPEDVLDLCMTRNVRFLFFEESFPRITATEWWTGEDLLS